MLGRRLNIEEADLHSIHEEEDQCIERAYQMLLKWKRAEGEAATYLELHNALRDPLVGRKDLAEEFCYEK